MKKVSAPAQAVTDSLTRWQPPECCFAIAYAPAVLEEIRRLATDAFFSLPHGGAEIGGILFGTRSASCVCILAFRALECEYAFGPTFTLSERDLRQFEGLLSSPDLRAGGWIPIGWCHSHTRSDLLLSARDLEVHQRFFQNPLDIALVVRPHAFDPMRAGFFFRQPDGSIHCESSYQEFRLLPSAAEARAPVPCAPFVTQAVVVPAPPSTPPLAPQTRDRSRRWFWAAALAFLIVGLCTGLIFLKPRLASASSPPSLSLMAYDLDGQLQIRWDRSAERIRRATFGSLEITDGSIRTRVNLEPQLLRSGSFSYARQSARIDVRLVAILPNAASFEESTTFLGHPPRTAWDGAAETIQLRQELEKQAARTHQLQREIDDLETELLRQSRSANRVAMGEAH